MQMVQEGLHVYVRYEYSENRYYETTELPVIRHNMLSSFLPAQIRESDGKKEVWHEITGKRSLFLRAESRCLTCQECRFFLESLCTLFHDLEQYLLSEDQVSFKKEDIYISGEGQFYWLYTPFKDKSVQSSMEELVLWMISVLDYHDKKALDLVWQTYHRMKKEGFHREIPYEILGKKEKNDIFEDAQSGRYTDVECRNHKYTYTKNIKADNRSGESMDDEDSGDGPGKNEKTDSTGMNRASRKKKRINPFYIILPFLAVNLAAFSYLLYCIHLRGSTVFLTACLMVVLLIFIFLLRIMFRYFPEEDKENVSAASSGCEMKQENTLDDSDIFRDLERFWEKGDETVLLCSAPHHPSPVLYAKQGKDSMEMKVFPFYIGGEDGLNQLSLKNRAVSRQHAVILKGEEELYYLEDLNSKNGTTVNHKKVDPADPVKLSEGDEISFADDIWIFRLQHVSSSL